MAHTSTPGGTPAARPRRATLAAGLALVSGGPAAACRPWRSLRAGRGEPGDPDDTRGAPGPASPEVPVRLVWAGTSRAADADTRGAVELTVVVRNDGPRATASTSILWEPAFARAFAFAWSEPAPWRVRTDERGWGVLDASGVLPRAAGTFRLCFDAVPGADGRPEGPPAGAWTPPRVLVVADGERVVAEAVADGRRWAPPAGAWRGPFERGPLARIADGAEAVPSDGRRSLPLLAGAAALLGTLVTGGILTAARAAGTEPARTAPAARVPSDWR